MFSKVNKNEFGVICGIIGIGVGQMSNELVGLLALGGMLVMALAVTAGMVWLGVQLIVDGFNMMSEAWADMVSTTETIVVSVFELTWPIRIWFNHRLDQKIGQIIWSWREALINIFDTMTSGLDVVLGIRDLIKR